MTRAAIKHAEDSLRSAMLEADVETLERLLHDDLVFLGPDGALASKEDDLENYRSGKQRIAAHRPRELRIALVADDVAVASVVVELEGHFGEAAIAGTFRYVRTWRREPAGAWRVVAGAVAALTGT